MNEADLERLINSLPFNPAAALNVAQNLLDQKQESAQVHFLAFMAHAELFAHRDGDWESHRGQALEHYNQAVALDSSFCLFPTKYQASGLIGVGALSYVFAIILASGHKVALKTLKRQFPLESNSRTIFIGEMKKLRGAELKNVAQIYEVSPHPPNGLFYLMEYVEAISLRDWINKRETEERKRREVSRGFLINALEIAIEVAQGLKAAYARPRGVLHLDLKPENILLAKGDGQEKGIKLIDFNFIRVQLGVPLPYSLSPIHSTLLYSAREVITNIENASVQSDIYSLGVIILEMLTGTTGRIPSIEMFRHLDDEAPDLAMFISACLQDDHTKRPKSWDVVIERLTDIHNELEETERVTAQIGNWPRPFRAAVKAGLAGPGQIIRDLFEVVSGESPKKGKELSIGLVGFFWVSVVLLYRLFTDGGQWQIDWSFLPCFIVAFSSGLLGLSYFLHVTFFCRFWRNPFIEWTRFLMAFVYILPILWARYYPGMWAFATASGAFVAAFNNVLMWTYIKRYSRHPTERFQKERRDLAATLKGWATWLWVYGLVFLFVGGLLNWWLPAGGYARAMLYRLELGAALGTAVTHMLVYLTKLRGDNGRTIWKGLRLEYAIRSGWQ
ncbi:MAG: serine/threonine protein kinase [Candidatus Binatia bacterium]